jgi:hypothetical protein
MPAIPDHLDVVKTARTRYDGLTGPARAHHVCNAVAWSLRGEGAGLFFKRTGSQFNQRSLDVIIYRGGETFDILRDAEGRAEPSWSRTEPTGMGDPQNWREPVDPSVLDANLDPAPPDGDAEPALDVAAELKAIRRSLDALIDRLE